VVAGNMMGKILNHQLSESSHFYIKELETNIGITENQPSLFKIKPMAMSGFRKET